MVDGTSEAFDRQANSSDATHPANTGEPPSAEWWNDTPLLAEFTVVTFAERIGNGFRARVGGERIALLELVAAIPYAGDATRATERAPFSLVFRGPRGVALPQGTYRVEHDDLGGFPLFLVPIAPDATGPRYEAVFA